MYVDIPIHGPGLRYEREIGKFTVRVNDELTKGILILQVLVADVARLLLEFSCRFYSFVRSCQILVLALESDDRLVEALNREDV